MLLFLKSVLQWHHEEGNFFLEYLQSNWPFYTGYWYFSSYTFKNIFFSFFLWPFYLFHFPPTPHFKVLQILPLQLLALICCPSGSCTVIYYIIRFTPLCKIFTYLSFLSEAFQCHMHHFQCLTVPVSQFSIWIVMIKGNHINWNNKISG